MSPKSTVTKPRHRVLVRASAGTGKTFALTNRYIRLLAQGAPAQTILAATFTRKAAGEIRDRVLHTLARGSQDASTLMQLQQHAHSSITHERCSDLLTQLSRNPDRIRICTLDSLLVGICQSASIELGSAPALNMLDDPTDQLLKERAAADALQDANPEEIAALLHMLYATGTHASRSVREAMLDAVSDVYEAFVDANNPSVMSYPSSLLKQGHHLPSFARYADALKNADVPCNKNSTEPNKSFLNGIETLLRNLESEDAEHIGRSSLVLQAHTGVYTYNRKPYTPSMRDAIDPIAHAVATRLTESLRRRNLAAASLLTKFHASYTAEKQRMRAMLFSDIATALNRLSGIDHTDLFARLDQTVRHVLLDEFQDTSNAQYRFFEPILDEITASEDEREIFIVGDTKQSLYQWRNARPALMERLSKNLRDEHLDRSFRTSQSLLDPINTVFESLTDAQCLSGSAAARGFMNRFVSHTAAEHLQHRPGYFRVSTTTESGRNAGTDPSTESTLEPAASTTQLCTEITQANPSVSIGVLTRTNKQITPILDALRDAGLNAGRSGGSSLASHPVVTQVIALLKFANTPSNTAQLALAASGPVGMSLDLNPFWDQQACHACASKIRAAVVRSTASTYLRNLIGSVIHHYNDPERIRLQALCRAARSFELSPSKHSLDSLIQYLERTKYTNSAAAQIQVMTIHQSKGLQFDCVVLPHADYGWSIGNSRVLVEPSPESDPTNPPSVITYAGTSYTRPYIAGLTELHENVFDQTVAEELCGMYVAMTRARYALEILTSPARPKKGKQQTSESARPSISRVVKEILTPGVNEMGEGSDVYATGQEDWATRIPNTAEPATKTAQKRHTRAIKLLPRHHSAAPGSAHNAPSAGHSQDALSIIQSSNSGKRFGQFMHAAMELLPSPLSPIGSEGLANQIEFAVSGAASVHASDESLIAQCSSRLTQALQNPLIYEILSPPATAEVLREHPLVGFVRKGNSNATDLVHGVVDRMHIHKSGDSITSIHIIDFKTDADATTDSLLAAHRIQMERYRATAVAAYGISVDRIQATLIGLATGIVVDVEQPETA